MIPAAKSYQHIAKLKAINADLLTALEQASTAFESACAYTDNAETKKFLLANAEISRATIAKARNQ